MLTPPALLRCITTTARARSDSRGSTGSKGAALEMPALVATLLLRRWEGKGQTGACTRDSPVSSAADGTIILYTTCYNHTCSLINHRETDGTMGLFISRWHVFNCLWLRDSSLLATVIAREQPSLVNSF
jgi:hypothetical protein